MQKVRQLEAIPVQKFQKSTFFLYPLLKTPKVVLPAGTYIAWGEYKIGDSFFICVYDKTDNPRLKEMEKNSLLRTERFYEFAERDKQLIYVFDFNDYSYTIEQFIAGEYSAFSDYAKRTIMKYYEDDPERQLMAHVYLYPELYYDRYSDLLEVDRDLFYEGTQLIQPPDLTLETLK